MGFKNWISVYCKDREIIKNYKNTEDHPLKNRWYGIHIDDDSLDGQQLSVRVSSCETSIHYVFCNHPLFEIKFQSFHSDERDDMNIFYFEARKGMKICFIEHQFARVEDVFDEDHNLKVMYSYIPMSIRNKTWDKCLFLDHGKKCEETCNCEGFGYILASTELSWHCFVIPSYDF